METKDEKTEKKQGIKFGSILLLLFLMVYIPSFIHWVYGRTIATGIIQIGKLEESINVDGIIVRDELALKSPFSGIYIPEAGEGEKIAANSSVATVLKESSDKLISDLKEKDLKIIKTQEEKSEKTEFFSQDLNKLEEEITQKLQLVIEDGNSNSLEREYQLKSEIDGLIQKKISITGGPDNSDKYINTLKKEKEALQDKIKQNTREIVSSFSGIISYCTDGYENILRPDAIKELTPGYLEEIKSKPIESDMSGWNVETDKPFVKVIRGVEAYIVFTLDESNSKKFMPGDSVKVRINEIGKTIDGKVSYISEKANGKYVISVVIDQGISETAGMRKINIDLITDFYEGYKVPLNSLKEIDYKQMKAKIILVKASYAYEKTVKIVGKDDEYAIIRGLDADEVKGNEEAQAVSLYDIFVLRPNNIKEGQYINQ